MSLNLDNIQPLLLWLAAHPSLSCLLIFLISLSESLVVVGLVVPGIALMLMIGTFVGAGYLGIWPAMISATLGAIAGDGISYYLGHNFQDYIRSIWIFRKYPGIIEHGERFFERHGGKSVLIGRFAGPVRPMIPAIAGMMRMPAMRFYVTNIISALIWAPTHLLPGYLFGNTLISLPSEVSKKLLIIVFTGVLAGWMIVKILKGFGYKFKRRIRRWSTKVWIYSERNSYKFLQKLIKHPFAHKTHQIDSFLYLLYLLFFTFIIVIFTKYHILITSLNPLFKHLALMLYQPIVDRTLFTINDISSIIMLMLMFLISIAYFAIIDLTSRKEINITPKLAKLGKLFYHLSLSLGLLAAFFITTYLISIIVKYPAPYTLPYDLGNLYKYSFPNISMGLITLLLGYIGILKYCNNPIEYTKSRYTLYASIILISFFTLKLLLGYVWLTDLIGAIAISSCLLLIFCIIYWQNPIENINIKKFNIIYSLIISVLIIFNSVHFALNNKFNKTDLSAKNQNTDTRVIDLHTWQNQSDLFANVTNPIINVQWLANREDIIEMLTSKNWTKQAAISFSSALKFLENSPNSQQIPLMPIYYQGHHSLINYSKPERSKKILHLRLWQSEYIIDNKILWVGTIEYLKPTKLFDFITVLQHWPRSEFTDATNKFIQDLESSFAKKAINYKTIDSQHSQTDDGLKIILIH